MRAPLIALVLVAAGAVGCYNFTQSAGSEPTAPVAHPGAGIAASDGVALSLFNEICIEGRQSFEQTESRALAAGWAQAPDDVHPNIARIMAISRGADLAQATDVAMHAYVNPERPQYLVLTRMNISGMPVNGCYVYDFGAAELPDLGGLGAALGTPTEQMSEPGVIEFRKWARPVALPGVATLRAGYFPQGSPAEAQLGFTGLLFAVTSMSR